MDSVRLADKSNGYLISKALSATRRNHTPAVWTAMSTLTVVTKLVKAIAMRFFYFHTF
ncbi:hypothetical protein [uncultured Nostoc sp.]|uniref:hypothetical protein n=1 Tax=uncultured Nostoc sp. TaxID=340711 RepID=UPI0035CB5EBA